LEKTLWRLSEKVSSRLKNSNLAGSTITLKLKTADFRQRTRSQSIHAPTQLAAKIFAISREMLAKEIDGTAFRLMGTGVSALRSGSEAHDTDMLDRRSADAERAIDGLRKKFGEAAVIRGIAYEGPGKTKEEFKPSIARLGILDVEFSERAGNHEVVVVKHQRPGDAVFEQFERHGVKRRLFALFGLGVVIVIAHRHRPACCRF